MHAHGCQNENDQVAGGDWICAPNHFLEDEESTHVNSVNFVETLP